MEPKFSMAIILITIIIKYLVFSNFSISGFWENSDTESEAGDFNISAGNNLSVQDDNEDEFDFGFYN